MTRQEKTECIVCEVCGQEFYVTFARRNIAKYCSAKCRYAMKYAQKRAFATKDESKKFNIIQETKQKKEHNIWDSHYAERQIASTLKMIGSIKEDRGNGR